MIDLHSHLLPGIDDGSADLAMSLEMARMWVADGVQVVACTPHILPGMYLNRGPDIIRRVAELQASLTAANIPLSLISGSDLHVVPNAVEGLRSGDFLPLGTTRYVLIEPPHNVAPPRIEDLFFALQVAGYVPILTHPERLSWIGEHYDTFVRLVEAGAWMQITAASIIGDFGKRPKYFGDRMIAEGLAHILATDAHDTKHRPPKLGAGRAAAARLVGEAEAERLVVGRPRGVIENADPEQLWLPLRRKLDPERLQAMAAASTGKGPVQKSGTASGNIGASPQKTGKGEGHGAAKQSTKNAGGDAGGIAGRLRRLFG